MEQLERKLLKVERSLRQWKILVLLAGFALVSLFLTGWATPVGTVKATRFELVDANGRIKSELRSNQDDGATLVLLGKQGEPSVFLVGSSVKPGLSISSTQMDMISLRIDEKGPHASLMGANGTGWSAVVR